MRRLLQATLCASLLCLVPSAALAWISLDGNSSPPHTVWSSVPVSWGMHQDGSLDLGADLSETTLLASFATWSEPTCTSWATTYTGRTGSRPSGGDGQNVQGWIEAGWRYGSGAIGVCSVSFWGGGTIGEADISYNGVNFTWNTTGGGGSAVDTQSIATHEQGHFLGLGNLYGSGCVGDPTMCGVYSGGTGARTLASDDINGVCTMYPSGSGGCVTDDDCSAGHHCEDGVCVPDVVTGEPCDPCTAHEECGGTNDLCLGGFPDGGMYCGGACSVPADCPSGFDCIEIGGAPVNQCVPSDFDCSSITPECDTDDDCPAGEICDGGRCVEETPDCVTDEDCPLGEICRDGECIPDPSPHLPWCAECTSHEECGDSDDLCLGGFIDGTSRCGISCESVGGNCGEGNTCYHFDDLPDQCIPASMDCSPDCSTDDDCPPGQHCVDGHCTNVCDPDDPTSCPDGWYCRFTSCATGVCEPAPDGPGASPIGARCATDLECESLRCQPMVDGSYCAMACDYLLGGGACPHPTACQPLERGLCGVCSCSAGRLGDPCSGGSQCQHGECTLVGGTNLCTIDCTGTGVGCPHGFVCTPQGDGTTSVCIPDGTPTGEPCETDGECAGGLCIEQGTSMVCSRTCGGESMRDCSCPVGYSCTEVAEGVNACVLSSLIMVSGCGCALAGAGGKAGGLVLLISMILGGYGLLRARRKISS